MATQEIIRFTQTYTDPSSLALLTTPLGALLALWLLQLFALLLVRVFFCLSCYKTLKKVPADFRLAPTWLCWLFLLPVIGYLFEWMMLPFIIPKSIQQYKANDPAVLAKAKSLFGIGLAYVLVSIALAIPLINFLGFIAAFILWIIYWMKVVDIRKSL